MSVFTLFTKGGIIMYPLLFCSFLSLAIAIERYLTYKDSKTSNEDMAKIIKVLQSEENNETKIDALGGISGDSAVIARFYLSLRGAKEDCIQSLETKVNILLNSYEEKLNFLSIIVTLSPLLGLLGTIFGMISAFSVFDLKEGQPFAITAGIGEALIATAFGLIVAIFTLILYAALKYKINQLKKSLEECCLQLLSVNK
ncbi:MAG: MotA/TolQ/ExbB proton channel family protein [Phascolarctobacterium sp.]|nr:MotA/TolQ/ExbB proton channel family protein [Phascolarctobacterium sp.]